MKAGLLGGEFLRGRLADMIISDGLSSMVLLDRAAENDDERQGIFCENC